MGRAQQVEPNPRVTSVNKEFNFAVKMVLRPSWQWAAVADRLFKVIAASVAYPGDAWDIVIGKAEITKVLPVFSVLTLSATGS